MLEAGKGENLEVKRFDNSLGCFEVPFTKKIFRFIPLKFLNDFFLLRTQENHFIKNNFDS